MQVELLLQTLSRGPQFIKGNACQKKGGRRNKKIENGDTVSDKHTPIQTGAHPHVSEYLRIYGMPGYVHNERLSPSTCCSS